MTLALTDAGLTIDTVDEIIAQFETAELSGISTTLDLVAPDPIAVINGIVAVKANQCEEILLALYAGMDPAAAGGVQLTALSELTGTERDGGNPTLVTCSITVDAAFSAAAGTMFASVVGDPSILFTNLSAFSAGGAGTTTGVVFECTVPGVHPVQAATLTVIASPINHWTAITNPAAGTTGTTTETDPALRVRRVTEIDAIGTTTQHAIKALVLKVLQPGSAGLGQGIVAIPNAPPLYSELTLLYPTLSCTVLANDTNVTDANGLPAHSIEVIAYNLHATSADDTALAALTYWNKAAGIATYSGNGTSSTLTAEDGSALTVYWTRPTAVVETIAITCKQAPGVTVSPDDIQAAIALYASGTTYVGDLIPGATGAWQPGSTAYQTAVMGWALRVPGVVNVSACVLGTVNSGNDYVPALREIVKVGVITVMLT